MKNTVIANRKKGDWEIIKKYFEDRGVDTSAFDGGATEKNECKFYFYGVINGEFENYALLEAQQANATILEVSDIDKEFKVGDVVKVVKPCKTSGNKKGLIGKITEIREGLLTGFGECIMYEIDGNYYEHISGIELVVSDTVTLPKSFVLEIYETCSVMGQERIEEVVPELFPKNELIVGKWYKSTVHKALFFVERLKFDDCYSVYGFDLEGNWVGIGSQTYYSKDLKPATEQEVFYALKNEAVKRGFKEGVEVNGSGMNYYYGSGNSMIIDNNSFAFNLKDSFLSAQSNEGYHLAIFDDGKWAEVIVEPIPDELQTLIKKLGKDKIIEILNSN